MKIKILCAIFVVVLSSAFDFQADLQDATRIMMKRMKAVRMTSNPDRDYAMMMIEHHQGSIDMSKVVLDRGKSDRMRELARQIVRNHPKEQENLRARAALAQKNQKANGNTAAGSTATKEAAAVTKALEQAVATMENELSNFKRTNDIDYDFAMIMIPHHQAAMDMSDAILKDGKDPVLRNIAEKIRNQSREEFAELKRWSMRNKNTDEKAPKR